MCLLSDICVCCLWTQTSSHHQRVAAPLPNVWRCWVMLRQVGSQEGNRSCIINWWLVIHLGVWNTQEAEFGSLFPTWLVSNNKCRTCPECPPCWVVFTSPVPSAQWKYCTCTQKLRQQIHAASVWRWSVELLCICIMIFFVSLDKGTYIKMTTEIFAKGLSGCHSHKVSRLFCRLFKSQTCFENKQSVASFPVPQPHFICNSLVSGVCFILQRLVVKTNLGLFPVVCANLEAAPLTAKLYLHSSHTVTFCIMSHCQTLSLCILTSRSSLFVATESFQTVSSSMEWNINIT